MRKIENQFGIKAFLCLLMLTTGREVYAQTCTVVILDSQTKHPLPAATVAVKGNGLPNTVLTTNNKGIATLKTISEGQYAVSISYLGYNTLDTAILIKRQQDPLQFLLSPSISALKGVTAVAKKPYLVLNKGKMILNVSESALATAGNAWDVLRYAPTVETSVSGKLNIRAQAATVYVDGRRIYLQGDELLQYMQGINGAEIDQIEIINHPGPSYPADVQTVISVKTKRLRSRGMRNTLMLAGIQGIYPRYNITERLDVSTRSLDIQAGYSFTHFQKGTTSYFETLQGEIYPWNVKQYNKTRQDNQRAYINTALHLPGGSLLTFYGELPINSNDAVIKSGNGLATSDRISKGDSVFRFHSAVHNKTIMPFAQLSFEKKWDSSRQAVKLQAEYLYNDRKYTNLYSISNFRDTGFIRERFLKDSLPQQLRTLVFSGSYNRRMWEGELNSGVRYSQTRLDNDNKTVSLLSDKTLALSDLIYKERNYALFSTWAKQRGKLYYEAGLRYEHNSVTAWNNGKYDSAAPTISVLLPSALLQWQISETHALILSYKRVVMKPDYFQLNSFSRFTDNTTAVFQGNQSIRPQLNNDIDLTWQAGSLLTLSAGAQMAKDFINIIFLRDKNNQLYQQYSNFDRANIFYLNTTFAADVTGFWQMRLNTNSFLADIRYKSVPRSRATPSLNMSYQNSFTLPFHIKLEAALSYNNTFSDGFFRHAEYAVADVAVRKQIPASNLTISLSGSTVFGPNETNRAIYNNIQYNDRIYHDARFARFILTWTLGKQTIRSIKKGTSASEGDQKRIKEKI
ncbi:outer membrane beta-barrel family protein [Chitinophaga rhizophila]|uniref:TonB-dependent receptor family protein n=1 Tax=Chitinophaga rhizophila TaxID=2866212 RepID=A0ABS7G7A0_9BACT|nr:outer membrane beta-barrel family protein [Chitinophaga rhizophila]MBW8683175.1 TonB-dependent receptor family protein [Chitinophaga rhizophila]